MSKIKVQDPTIQYVKPTNIIVKWFQLSLLDILYACTNKPFIPWILFHSMCQHLFWFHFWSYLRPQNCHRFAPQMCAPVLCLIHDWLVNYMYTLLFLCSFKKSIVSVKLSLRFNFMFLVPVLHRCLFSTLYKDCPNKTHTEFIYTCIQPHLTMLHYFYHPSI